MRYKWREYATVGGSMGIRIGGVETMHMECRLKEMLDDKLMTFEYVESKTGIRAEVLRKISVGDFKALRKHTLVSICEVAHCQISDFIIIVPD